MYIYYKFIFYINMGCADTKIGQFKDQQFFKYQAIVNQLIKQDSKSVLMFSSAMQEKIPKYYSLKENQAISTTHSFTQHSSQSNNFALKQIPNTLLEPYRYIGSIWNQNDSNQMTLHGTGTLIYNNFIITSASNVYCRKTKKQYSNLKFIIGDSSQNFDIYDIKQVYYPVQYTKSQAYNRYNFAIIETTQDLSTKYGYIGWDVTRSIENQNSNLYGYMSDSLTYNKESMIRRQIQLTKKYKNLSGNPLIIEDNNLGFTLIGIRNETQKQQQNVYLNNQIRQLINKWTIRSELDLSTHPLQLGWKHLGSDFCKYFQNVNFKKLKNINLYNNNIGTQGCQYLIHSTFSSITSINLSMNNIGDEGCKHLSKISWINLNHINLNSNNIEEGCKYLRNTNWKNLLSIDISYNKLNTNNSIYLKDCNWFRLKNVTFTSNKISEIGYIILKQLGQDIIFYY